MSSSASSPNEGSYWVYMGLIIVLVMLGGLVAGLTIGIMSLDETKLHILKQAGNKHAQRIEPVRKIGHLLLVTLLLANTIINETLPILLHTVNLQGYQAVIASTLLIVLFGEIIPQAVCARYGLAIGAFFAWPLRVLVALLWVVAFPIAKLLDCVLGVQHGYTYQRAELRELVAYHGEDQAGTLTRDEVAIVRSILDVKDKSVMHIMTELKDVFMLPLNSRLDRETLNTVIQAGHSRVPVYSRERSNIIGVVLVKHLVLFDLDDAMPLSNLNLRKLPYVSADTSLFEMLHVFEQGGSHMALVVSNALSHSDASFREDTQMNVIGLVTLEDVIEELLGEEIIDETDVFRDIRTKVKVVRAFSKHLFDNSNSVLQTIPHSRGVSSEDSTNAHERAPLLHPSLSNGSLASSSAPGAIPQIVIGPSSKMKQGNAHASEATSAFPKDSHLQTDSPVNTENSGGILPQITHAFGLGKRNKKFHLNN